MPIERPKTAVVPEASATAFGGSPSSPERVVSAIYRGILAGRVVPGQKLIEADLADSLNVSRGPIREALKRLHAEGVVEITRHRGAYVRLLNREEAVDFLEVLSLLTGYIARKAAKAVQTGGNAFLFRNEAPLQVLRQLVADSGIEVIRHERNGRFYDALIELGGNTQIAGIMPVMRIQLFRLQGYADVAPSDHETRVAELAEVARHVLAGDPMKAHRAMTQHMELTLERLHSLPDEAFGRS